MTQFVEPVTEQPAPSDPGALILPFGKHKGATVAELLARDPSYADWVVAQGWVAQRFAELHAAILSRGAGSDDTPEHTALQARFLDPAFREACLRLVARKGKTLDGAQKRAAVGISYGVTTVFEANGYVLLFEREIEGEMTDNPFSEEPRTTPCPS